MVAPSKPPSFMKGLFDSALGDVMSNIISDLGHELSDDVLNTRATRAFRAFDTDGSGRLEFHELLRAMDTLPHSCRCCYPSWPVTAGDSLHHREWQWLVSLLVR